MRQSVQEVQSQLRIYFRVQSINQVKRISTGQTVRLSLLYLGPLRCLQRNGSEGLRTLVLEWRSVGIRTNPDLPLWPHFPMAFQVVL